MKPLSLPAAELVATLEQPVGILTRITGGRDITELLRDLERFPEAALVPHLLPIVFGGSADESRLAATVLRRVLAGTPIVDLPDLDEFCRRQWPYHGPAARDRRQLRIAGTESFSSNERAALAAVTSFHPDGFVRERAVAELDQVETGDELRFLLLRLNDWVAQVADRAQRAVERRVVPAYAKAFVESMPLLLRLTVATRRDHTGLVAGIHALLQDPAQRGALESGFTSTDRSTRRVTFRLARESTVGLSTSFHSALRDSDPIVRLEAAVHARRRLSRDELARALPPLAANAFMPVRREGLLAALEHFSEDARVHLERALLDQHRSLRELARFHLAKRAVPLDVARFYRERLSQLTDRRMIAAAIAGIGESGDPTDVVLVAPFLRHERVSLRRAAMQALARLDPERVRRELVGLLSDESPGVSRTARDLLLPVVHDIGPDRVRAAYHSAHHRHGKLNALSLAHRFGKWESLPLLLEGTRADDPRVRTIAEESVRHWVANANRSFAPLLPNQHEVIVNELRNCRFSLDDRIADEIRAILRFWTERA